MVTNTIWSREEPTPGSFLNTLYIQLDREFGVDALKAEAADAAVLAARQNSYHPVRDYLDSLTAPLSEDEWDTSNGIALEFAVRPQGCICNGSWLPLWPAPIHLAARSTPA